MAKKKQPVKAGKLDKKTKQPLPPQAPPKQIAKPARVTTAAPATVVSKPPYRYYDRMFFRGEPASHAGMSEVWEDDRNFFPYVGGKLDLTMADETLTRDLAKRVEARGCPLILDIETWPVDIRYAERPRVLESVAKLVQVAAWIKSECPQLTLGFYGLTPLRDYWTPVSWRQGTAAYRAWQEANDVLRPVAERADMVCPSLYTFYEDPEGWQVYAEANIAEARRYGKPVWPYLWMYYHDSTERRGQTVPPEYWRRQLATCRRLADSVVIWGGWQQDWDENAAWWRVTQEFLTKG